MSTLHEAPEDFRRMAAEERAAGNERLADDMERMAAMAASWLRMAGAQPRPSTETEAA